jgi:cyclophilin family peptidyl-prolyl cis-trans isomerase
VALVVSVSGCGSSAGSRQPSTGSATATGKPTVIPPRCHAVATPKPHGAQNLKAPRLRLDPAKTYTVTISTNCGTFAFVLDVRQSPKTSASFYDLVKHGFYDGLLFQRVATGFVIQGGSPLDENLGGPGYTVVEPPPARTQYVRGDVAMARTEIQPSGASGSQFFVVTAANATRTNGLQPSYALVGKVVSGQSVVDTIGGLPTNPPGDGMPSPAVVMTSVTVSSS